MLSLMVSDQRVLDRNPSSVIYEQLIISVLFIFFEVPFSMYIMRMVKVSLSKSWSE